ncbi:tetratricopeptide repeat protein [Moheibacter sediminis]|uniref:Tetratricopeptide repeat-containing protein n=1 Tax=Moheibacter sediminis TaxID=1434700 RepID=A0A1W2C4C4_9FLAO|nr:tetratricopeptide repeat protein [Moheibacter sediminis]SMC80013.1 Tetratricopeptide repeat-containing protein [Moheibacter sediminis]
MKKIILTISAVFMMSGVFAQEKEIDAALKAFESKNNTAAKSELNKVSGLLTSNTISPESLAKYYYVSGQIALNEGNTIEAAKQFGELAKYESGTMFSVKNKSTKATEYYATQAEADKAAASGDYSKPKQENLKSVYLPQIQESVTSMAEKTLQAANTAYQAEKNEEAGNKFLEASYLVKALGGNSQLFKYNAALSYHRGGIYEKAFQAYKDLIKDEYTGETVSYLAKDKEGNEVPYSSKEEAENHKKLGLIASYKEVKTPSMEKELYLNALKALSGLEKYDDLVETITKKYPQDSEIQTVAGNIYHKSGNEEGFLNKLIENTKLNPADPTNYFNIGVIYMEQGKDAEAIQFFEKTIQVDPKYKNAYNNLALVKVKPEKEYVEIINANLGSTAKEKQAYQEYTKKRKDLYISIIPYLEKAFELDKTDLQAASTLRKAYQAGEMFEKEDQMRAIEKSLGK